MKKEEQKKGLPESQVPIPMPEVKDPAPSPEDPSVESVMKQQSFYNMEVWDAWSETPPQFTKKVSFGPRTFTAIAPYWQMEQMTRLFGPVGKGWGWSAPQYEIISTSEDPGNTLLQLTFELWYKMDLETYRLPMCNVMNLFQWMKSKNKYEIDADAWKKLLTDTITKAFSYLGCSADVFMGRYDDNRYVAEMKSREWDERKHTWADDMNAVGDPSSAVDGKKPGTGNGQPENDRESTKKESPEPSPDPGKPEQSGTFQKKKDLWTELVLLMKGVGVFQEAITRHMKEEHGYESLHHVPLPYLVNLLEKCKVRVDLYNKIQTAVKFLHGQDWQDKLSDLVDELSIDLLASEPASLEEILKDLNLQYEMKFPK